MVKQILYTGLDPSHFQARGSITHIPLIRIVPRPLSDPCVQQALQNFSAYTHIIITSRSTVLILEKHMYDFGLKKEAWSAKIHIAVGRGTAAQLKSSGICPAIIAKTETAEGVVEELKKISLYQTFFFWPHSSQARPVLQTYLEQSGAPFHACQLYDTVSCCPPDLNVASFDEIIFTSPSTVDAFFNNFGRFPDEKIYACIGPVTQSRFDFRNRELGRTHRHQLP
ncbi:MAG: uroporphyrinogen-III synthase [Candidatus Protochlamydia sp.]|nr:uroporphyrinogen-III synthase [Candidatus Protochlamydia sp.]